MLLVMSLLRSLQRQVWVNVLPFLILKVQMLVVSVPWLFRALLSSKVWSLHILYLSGRSEVNVWPTPSFLVWHVLSTTPLTTYLLCQKYYGLSLDCLRCVWWKLAISNMVILMFLFWEKQISTTLRFNGGSVISQCHHVKYDDVL